ncbi:hypothetical protein NDK50_15095 [Paraburkholderia bryophila]|uniref:hypothetical protein n=1 Tax=Paraburkholderia bryophila TaxID=420952 RepID=UPI00234AB9AC|nr:hypothetical protein [Paraburkholderia bryophila]WCM18756.1 hypothetical protein NDK50_15095 [Paraburkholderia bryophila]
MDDPIAFSRAHHVSYVITTDVTQTSDGPKADTALYDSATGARIFMALAVLTGDANVFARNFYILFYSALLLSHAHQLSVRRGFLTA